MCQDCQSYIPAAFTPQETYVVLISVRKWVEPTVRVRLEGIEHATFRLVGQFLNKLRHRVFISSIIVNES